MHQNIKEYLIFQKLKSQSQTYEQQLLISHFWELIEQIKQSVKRLQKLTNKAYTTYFTPPMLAQILKSTRHLTYLLVAQKFLSGLNRLLMSVMW